MECTIACKAQIRATQRCRTRKVEKDQFVSKSKILFLEENKTVKGRSAKEIWPVRYPTYAMISPALENPQGWG